MTRSSSSSVRSVYIARLRRAFLLRVHPDRFRAPNIRAQQARLVQALSNRMSQPDFIAWQQQQQDAYHPHHQTHATDTSSYPFVLEKRDGSLFQTNLMMNASVDSILSTIAQGLKQVGASLPEPPPATKKRTLYHHHLRTATHPNHQNNNHTHNSSTQTTSAPPKNHAGRSLQEFLALQRQQPDEIQKRRNSRVDAQAAALTVRRLYRFQAVDATSLGWSSAWVATLFRQLLELHHAHECNFQVDSFYPIRLVFSNAAAKVSVLQDKDHALDVHGGVLRLSPAGTGTQWLETLGSVTAQHMQEIQYHQSQILAHSKTIASALGAKVKKGHSCSNVEYCAFLERLSQSLGDAADTTTTLQSSSFYPLSNQPMVMIVETSQMCRRPMVTHEGQLRLGACMDPTSVLRALTDLGPHALQRRDEYEHLLEQQKEWIQQAQSQLGLQHVYCATGSVTPKEFGHCLERLLWVAGRTKDLRLRLGGNSLGIAGSDRFCHLADDGSLVIPHNWL